jgi:predicted Fe-S protein YdhL (DUF1289 family)
MMAEIETPCDKVCTLDPASGLCLGCGRSLSEIERWAAFNDAERSRVIKELPRRLEALRTRAAGATGTAADRRG